MRIIRLRVEPVLCGPVSVGTVGLIQLVRERLGLSLAEAKACVDRCVFGGETVTLAAPSGEAAATFAREVAVLASPAKFHAEVVGVDEPEDAKEPPGVCPACGLPIRPGTATVTDGYWAMSAEQWGISHRCRCPGCGAELIAGTGNRRRWEQQEPASVVWHRFLGG